MHAMTEDIIETCHNGIVAWDKESKVKPILIKGDNDYIKTKERWKIITEFFVERNVDYYEINSANTSQIHFFIDLLAYLLNFFFLLLTYSSRSYFF